ncbi:xanthine dehydrogenase family protein molybdopterin-binding subunit [Cumulibacter manganitolerans]|uniref:xanthine dehydrogenase family protein molybdopterin-binding subunit n=1 Tax=Cumulibacter manganitolerans TaxID=1884992 RepID=UPI001295602A|nr:xanthine dehydrogenase family protein molybdopterin-binding subunit [Cumulibacter manganitolerans]
MTTTARTAPQTWVGQRVPRREDDRLVRGAGHFTDDVQAPNALHAAFVRSAIAAGTILSIDVAPALEVPGVHAVLTAADLGDPRLRAVLERPGFVATDMPLLASSRVRYCGEPIAVVLAEDPYCAEDGADAVLVDIDAHPAPVSIDDAGRHPLHDEAPDGVLVDLQMFEDESIEQALADSALVLEEGFRSARVNAAPMECRSVVADVDRRSGQLVVHLSTQVPHQVRSGIAQALGVAEHGIRVIAPDVGGGFGLKCVVGREEVVAAAAARRLGRAVRWSEDRVESLTASFTGHEQRYRVRAGFDADGRLTAIDADVEADIGAYSAYPFTCGVEPLMACTELPGVYRVGRYAARGRGYTTAKCPTAPYRGVSRPQIVLVMERLMDKAAARLGLDPIEIRRRNLITEFPYTGPNLITYEPGSYLESLERCEAAIDDAGWRRRAAQPAAGERYGIGIACFSERSAYGTPTMGARRMGMTPGYDVAHVRMDPTGHVTVTTGTCGHGQGHETTFAQIVADQLGITPDEVRIRQGDTDLSSYGWGTFASRSLVIGGTAIRNASVSLAESLKRVASDVLEADPRDISLRDGNAVIDNVVVPISELAARVHFRAHEHPDQPDHLLEARGESDPDGCFSNATHAALVRIDEGTGHVQVEDYIVVEDCGVVVNPMIVDGQVRGGVAQGIACALLEHLEYADDGQPLSGSFMDYLVPTACEIPEISIHHLETRNDGNPLGAKGMGEGGTIGAPAAVLSAVNDALRGTGAQLDCIPVLPHQVRAALHGDGSTSEETA